MSTLSSAPARPSLSKRSIYGGPEHVNSEEPAPRSKYARTGSRRQTLCGRRRLRESLAAADTLAQQQYAGPTSAEFDPTLKLGSTYPETYTSSPLITSSNSLANTYQVSTSPHSVAAIQATRHMSMSSWLGDLNIIGSPQQIDFMSRSHIRDHLSGNYVADNRIDDFEIGEILIVPWYSPNMDERNAIGTPTVAYASSTGPICAKKRPVVILFKNGQNLITLPFASSGGMGTYLKSVKVRKECPMVRQADDHDLFWDTTAHVTVHGDFRPMPGTHIQAMHPYTIGCHWPVKRTGGYLDKTSLVDLCFQLSERAMQAAEYLATLETGLAVPVQEFGPSRDETTARSDDPGDYDGQEEKYKAAHPVIQKKDSLGMIPRSVSLRRQLQRR